jgi:hypothetical protein
MSMIYCFTLWSPFEGVRVERAALVRKLKHLAPGSLSLRHGAPSSLRTEDGWENVEHNRGQTTRVSSPVWAPDVG